MPCSEISVLQRQAYLSGTDHARMNALRSIGSPPDVKAMLPAPCQRQPLGMRRSEWRTGESVLGCEPRSCLAGLGVMTGAVQVAPEGLGCWRETARCQLAWLCAARGSRTDKRLPAGAVSVYVSQCSRLQTRLPAADRPV